MSRTLDIQLVLENLLGLDDFVVDLTRCREPFHPARYGQHFDP